jgi:hypothetical protein
VRGLWAGRGGAYKCSECHPTPPNGLCPTGHGEGGAVQPGRATAQPRAPPRRLAPSLLGAQGAGAGQAWPRVGGWVHTHTGSCRGRMIYQRHGPLEAVCSAARSGHVRGGSVLKCGIERASTAPGQPRASGMPYPAGLRWRGQGPRRPPCTRAPRHRLPPLPHTPGPGWLGGGRAGQAGRGRGPRASRRRQKAKENVRSCTDWCQRRPSPSVGRRRHGGCSARARLGRGADADAA